MGISPDNHWVVTGSRDGTVRMWDLTAKDWTASPVVLHGHESRVRAMHISADNHWAGDRQLRQTGAVKAASSRGLN